MLGVLKSLNILQNMGFLAGYVLGVAAGIGLIIGFARYQNIRSKRRTDLVCCLSYFILFLHTYIHNKLVYTFLCMDVVELVHLKA